MITYEEALKKALELKPTADNCTEYENGYVFGCYDDSNYDGTRAPVAILKEDGRAVVFTYFIAQIGTGKELRRFDLPKK